MLIDPIKGIVRDPGVFYISQGLRVALDKLDCVKIIKTLKFEDYCKHCWWWTIW